MPTSFGVFILLSSSWHPGEVLEGCSPHGDISCDWWLPWGGRLPTGDALRTREQPQIRCSICLGGAVVMLDHACHPARGSHVGVNTQAKEKFGGPHRVG